MTNTMSISVVKHMSATESNLAVFQLEPKQQRFIQLYMTGNYTMAKIAELLDIHPNTAHNWMKKKEIKNALEEAQHEIQDQVSAELKSLTIKAVRKLNDLVDSPQDAIAMQAVKDILDRGGHKSVQKMEIKKEVTTIEQKMQQLIESTIIDMPLVEEVGESDDE